MLRFFRFNDPYRLLVVFLIVLLLGIKAELEFPSLTLPELKAVLVGEMMADGKRMYSEVWDSTPPVAAFVQSTLDVLFDRAILPRHIVSCLILFLQSAFFGILLINNRAFNESGYLPSLVFGLLCFFSFDTVSLTGEIIGSSLLLLSINNLLKEIEFKKQRDETIHNLGFFLGLASLCEFSYIIFFFGTAALLFIFTRVDGRRFVLFVFGFLLPHLIINTWYFWNDEIDLLWANFYLPNLNLKPQTLISSKSLLVLCAVPLFYFFASLIMTRRDARLTKYQSQILQVMLLWFALGLVEFYFTKHRTPQALLVCVPPMAYFISLLFFLIKHKRLAEAALWAFIIGIIAMNSLSVRNKVSAIDLSAVFVLPVAPDISGKKILVLDDPLVPYINNEPSGFFLEWSLARHLFETPGYYQHVVTIDDALKQDPPEIIEDPHDLLPDIMSYLPDLQTQYKRQGSRYVRSHDDKPQL
jgi:hypothetical protein